MNRSDPVAIALLVAWLLSAAAEPAAAHPLGQESVCQWAGLSVEPRALRLHYIVDLAEIPAFQVLSTMDRDQDGEVSSAERNAYLDRLEPVLAKDLELRVDGQRARLRPLARSLRRSPGQENRSTLQLDFQFQADIAAAAAGRPVRVEYRDRSDYTDGGGWKEVVVRAGPGCRILESTAPAKGRSDELRNYPAFFPSPPNQSEARFVFTVDAGPGGLEAPHTPAREREDSGPVFRPRRSSETLTRLLEGGAPSGGMLWAAFLIAAGLGGLHALSPGHGKTVVAAYLIGQRGTYRHALGLGLTVTLTHTIGVFALGLLVLAGKHVIRLERIDRLIGAASGLMVALIGLALLWGRLRSLWRAGAPSGRWAHLRAHFLGLEHHHHGPLASGHAHHHPHDVGAGHSHPHPAQDSDAAEDVREPHGRHEHHHHPKHNHHHGPAADPLPPAPAATLGGILGLGISGGMAPCPSALVLLLAAISIHRVGFGLLLIVAFSLGLASVLTLIGILTVGARAWLDRFTIPKRPRWSTWLPVGSAAAVTVLGFAIAVRALRGG